MLRTVNRVLLAVAGVVLIVAGAASLALAADVPSRLGVSLPDALPWTGPDDVLAAGAEEARWRTDGWWWPLAAGVFVLLALATWWLVAQLRHRRLAEITVDSGDGVGAALRGRAMEDVMAAEAEALPGVDQARVTLVGHRGAPRVRIGLVLAAHAHPGEVVRRLEDEVLHNARVSAGLARLPAETRLRAVRRPAERVS